ncbi:3-keto-disaccharide hydrolase [Lutimonas sp.]|uniref:3-keto-disaccharide hydrolase n=1 Tax=Lutimonas sp. TaxID=1872403 RepID=UPI003D9BFBB1
MKHLLAILVLCTFLISCKKEAKNQTEAEPQEVNQEETMTNASEEWIYLFDGVSTDGWRAYNGETLPPGWVAKDSVLTFDTELGMEQDYTGGQDIIYAKEEFDNFELYVEWKIPEGGNSGIFYHLKEGIEGAGPPDISPEYQLIDDANYAKIHDLTSYNKSMGVTGNLADLQDWQKTASDYAMHPANDAEKILHPVGEWNSTRIIFTPEKVEHWLNGKLLVSFVPWDAAWEAKKNAGKWKDADLYGSFNTGYIGFQDHSSPIWFKNIKIKKL